MASMGVVSIVLENEKSLRALIEAAELLAELEDDFPYRPEIKAAIKRLRYASRHLRVDERAAT